MIAIPRRHFDRRTVAIAEVGMGVDVASKEVAKRKGLSEGGTMWLGGRRRWIAMASGQDHAQSEESEG